MLLCFLHVCTPPSVAGGQSAWHVAAREGQAEVLKAMADALKAASSTALAPMRELGDTADEIIESLAGLKDSKGLTPLHLACIKGHADVTEVLMELGANPFAMVRQAAVGIAVLVEKVWLKSRQTHLLW